MANIVFVNKTNKLVLAAYLSWHLMHKQQQHYCQHLQLVDAWSLKDSSQHKNFEAARLSRAAN